MKIRPRPSHALIWLAVAVVALAIGGVASAVALSAHGGSSSAESTTASIAPTTTVTDPPATGSKEWCENKWQAAADHSMDEMQWTDHCDEVPANTAVCESKWQAQPAQLTALGYSEIEWVDGCVVDRSWSNPGA